MILLHRIIDISHIDKICDKVMRGSRIFRQGGPGQSAKKLSQRFYFFFVVFFFSPQLILQKSNGQFQRNLSFFKVSEAVQHFRGGGVQLFPGGGGPIPYFL